MPQHGALRNRLAFHKPVASDIVTSKVYVRSKVFRSPAIRMTVTIIVGLFLSGCSEDRPFAYSTNKKLTEIPSKHQTEVKAYLEEYFGTPLAPTHKAPLESKENSESGNGAAPSARPRLTDEVDPGVLRHGQEFYQAQCAGCHGVSGDGKGVAAEYLNPLPRDYRLGRFKFQSTPRGSKPRHEDLVRTIRRGAKGTSMPAFRWIADEDLAAVIAYVVALSSRGELEGKLIQMSEDDLDESDSYEPAKVADLVKEVAESWKNAGAEIVLPKIPMTAYTDKSIELGARAFVKENCFKCHGVDGRGNKTQNVGKDDWGQTAYAANLASGMLHGGRRPLDIFRRIHSGINGTPMPGYETALADRPETIWNLVHFVTSIVEGKKIPEELLRELADEAAKESAKGAATTDASQTNDEKDSSTPEAPEPEPAPEQN